MNELEIGLFQDYIFVGFYFFFQSSEMMVEQQGKFFKISNDDGDGDFLINSTGLTSR